MDDTKPKHRREESVYDRTVPLKPKSGLNGPPSTTLALLTRLFAAGNNSARSS